MRVTFVIPGPAGGGTRSVTTLANGLIARGHEARILYPRPRRGLKGALRYAYVSWRYGSRQDWLREFAGETVCYDVLTPDVAGRSDAIIGVGVDCMLAIAPLPDSCGRKVHNSHGMEPWIQQRMDRAWSLPVPRIICASYLESQMRRRGSTDPIFLVPNGVDERQYFVDPSAGPRDGVGTVFHKGVAKDPDTVRAVLWKLHERHPGLPLYVFGTSRPTHVPPTVRCVRFPTIEQARRCYGSALVWFCGSRNEGFSMPLLEAMACGCAVVSTDCGGPSDFITDGHNGCLVPVEDVEGLAARISSLLDDRPRLDELARAARETAHAFTWDKAVDKLEAALGTITAAAPSKIHDGAHAAT